MNKVARLRSRNLDVHGTSDGVDGRPSAPLLRRVILRGVLGARDYGELFRTVIGPLLQLPGISIRLTVQIEADLAQDAMLSDRDPVVRRLREAARRLGLNIQLEAKSDSCNRLEPLVPIP